MSIVDSLGQIGDSFRQEFFVSSPRERAQGSPMVKNRLLTWARAGALAVVLLLLSSCQGVALLDPQGPVGHQAKDLLMLALGLGFLVVVPVIAMTFWFAYRYREKNAGATYKPHWESSVKIEIVVWAIPVIIIAILSYLTWVKTMELDPYRPIPSAQAPVKVQVVSLDWNWLFIYPDYHVASINKLVIPADTPISFDLTSATVMTSFFIPDLGSQIYVMAGMVSHLNLLADRPGTYTGRNLGFSGEGYAKMNFPTVSVTVDQFKTWTTEAQSSPTVLNWDQFSQINRPQANYPVTVYSSVESDLFQKIVAQFMTNRHVEAKVHGESGSATTANEEQH